MKLAVKYLLFLRDSVWVTIIGAHPQGIKNNSKPQPDVLVMFQFADVCHPTHIFSVTIMFQFSDGIAALTHATNPLLYNTVRKSTATFYLYFASKERNLVEIIKVVLSNSSPNFLKVFKKKFFFGHWFIFHSLSLLNDWSIKYALKSMDQPLLCFYITVKVAKNRLYISLYGRGLAMNLTGPHKSQMTWPPNSPDPDWIKHPWNVPQPTVCRKEMFGSHHVEQ